MISDITCINYAKRHIVPEHILKHHMKEIYIHDHWAILVAATLGQTHRENESLTIYWFSSDNQT